MRLAAIVLIAALSLPVFGQRRFVVVDIETGVPISGVNVVSSTHQADTTNWQGQIDIPDTCRTLLFSHVNYESRMVNVTELRDTVFLISKLLNLKEVVVFGKGKGNDELTERLRKQMRIDKTEKELAAADPSAGFNVLGLVSKLFSRRKESKKEKLRRILEDY
jgi:hypothetical protein